MPQINFDQLEQRPIIGRLAFLDRTTQRLSDGREREVVRMVVYCLDGSEQSDVFGTSQNSPKRREIIGAFAKLAEEGGGRERLSGLIRYEQKYYSNPGRPEFSYSALVPVELVNEDEFPPDEDDMALALTLATFGLPDEDNPVVIIEAMSESLLDTPALRQKGAEYGGLIGWLRRLYALGLLEGTVEPGTNSTAFHITRLNYANG